MTKCTIKLVPEEVINIWVILESRIVTVEQRCNSGWDLAFPIQNGNQDMFLVIYGNGNLYKK